MANNLSRKEIENIYNSTPAPSNGMSRDEIANIYNSYTPEIPKLEQNTTPTPTSDYRAEIERMNKIKADTTAPRTEGENQAIDTYLNSLVEAQRYMDSNKPTTTTSSKVKKQPIGTVEIKADGTRRFTKAMSANEKKNFENQIRRQNQLEQAKVVGKQAKENAQPRERALSANEQRDLERAQNTIAQAKKNDNPYKKLSDTAKKFTELPKKDKPRYDDRGFEINPSITENQSTVDEYLDPNKKLSQADEKKAKQLIREYEESDLGQKNENATTLVFDNEHPDGMAVPSYTVDENGVYQPSKELTPEERQYQQSIGALKTKVNDSESFLVGAMQTVPFVDALQRAGDENGEYARMVANSQKQNPLSYWGGLLGTGVAMNAAGQFALNGTKYGDLINRIAGVDKAGISNRSKAIRRTLAEAAMDVPVDLATDIIPTLTSDLAQDKSAGEVIGNTAFNIGLNGLLNLAPAAISNWSDIRPNGIPEVWTPNKQATQSAVDNVIPVVDDVVPQEAKVVDEVKKAIDDIPEVVENPVVENVPENGIQVYRGYNRSDNPLEKNLAREQSIYDVLGKENPNNPDMLPLEFYTDSIDDATNYANHDKAFYESLRDGVVSDMNRQIIEGKTISDKEAYIKDAMDKAYRTLTGREPIFENGRVDTHTINPKKVLDLSELGEMTDANSVYKRLSEITGIPTSEIDDALRLFDIPNAEDGFYTYHLLKNMAGTNGDIGTRFTNFMRNQGYDAVKYGEDGANHYALLNNLAPEAAQNEKQIVSLNPDLNRAEDAELFKTVENNSNIDVKSVKAANKQLDNNINSLANMFGKQKNNEGVVALKEALNEYAETGSDEALARARQIASEMDQYYSGATYKSRKGNITDFGNGTQGTFTSQVEDFAEKLGAGAAIKSKPLHVTDLDKRINDLFSKYDLTAEDAESVRAWKQAINDYMANPTEEGWNNLLATTSDVSRRSNNLTEFVSSYKGKTKTNPFDQSELISIMDEIDTRRPLSSGVPDVEAPVNANNIPPTNNVPPTPPVENVPLPEKGTGELKIGKYRTNSMEKTGLVNEETDPLEDYGYNVFGVEEQRQAYKERYKDSQDMARDLRQRATWDEVDARAAQDEWTELMRKGDPESMKAAKKLKLRMNYELREGGRLIQVAAELDDTASQLNQAQKAINDLVDKVKGAGTSEALDNLAMKISDAYDASKSKEDFIQRLNALLNKNLKSYAPSVKKMTGKDIQGVDSILNSVKKAKSLEDMSLDDILNSIYKANGGVSLTVEEQKKIYDILEDAKQYKPGSYAQELRLARAAKIATARTPSTLGQKVRGVLYTNMLGNFKTAVSRNAWGNLGFQPLEQAKQPFAALYDSAISKATGQRSALGWNKQKTKGYFRGLGKGAADQARDMKYHVNTGRSGEFGWANALKNNNSTWISPKGYKEGFEDGTVEGIRNSLSRMANDAEFYVTGAMKFGDRPFYEANYEQAKIELQQLLNRYGKNGVVGFEGIPDDSVDDVIDMIASIRAADSVFQKHGKMSEGLSAIRNGLADVSRGAVGVDILSTAASPFTMTPGNMLEKAIEYSPLGLIKNSVETGIELANGTFNQRRFVDELARTTTGIPVLAGAYGLAKAGGITGGFSEDPDERSAQRNEGYIEYGLKNPFNDKVYDASDIPVFGPFLQAGGAIAENGLNKDSLLQAAEAVTMGSAMQGYRKAFGADAGYSTNGRMVDNFFDTIKSSGTQLVPSLVRQTAQTTDKYKRDLGEYGTNQYYWNNILNSIPGLRETLPIKYDNEGNPVLQNQGRDLGSKILENFIYPMNVSEYSPSELSQEASRLLKETEGDARGFVPYAQRKDLRSWVPEDEYSEELFREYKQELGEINSSVGNALLESDYYNSLEPAKQVNALADIYSGIKAYEKEKYSGEATDNKIAKAYKEGGEQGVIDYLEGKDIVSDSGVSTNSKAANYIQNLLDRGDKEGAKQLSSDLSYLRGEGLSTEAQGAYASRGSRNFDADTYASMYSQIDISENDGEGNGKISQKELIPYLEEQRKQGKIKNDQDALRIWEGFLTDYEPGKNQIPKWDKETGTYKTVKPGDDFETTIPTIEEDTEEVPGKPPRPNTGVKTSQNVPTQDEEWDRATLSSDPYTAISQSGVGHGNQYIDQAWDKAVLANSSLTPQEFIDTWAAIDSSGNGKHTKDEFKAYLNDNSIDQEEGNMILDMYYPSNWKRPTYKKGKWS